MAGTKPDLNGSSIVVILPAIGLPLISTRA
ncbi:Uncharacterised protein [Vibrio cholerae]|nr:Uncharacterised protein [Vibrio cholerae]